MDLSDPELIARCQDDRNAAHASFRALYERHAPAGLRFLRGLLDEGLAQDALQETFLRVFRQLDRYDPKRSFRAWLLGIARHVAQDTQRWRSRRPAASLDVDVSAPGLPGPEGLARRSEARALLERSVRRLPAPERDVFLLKQIEGLTFQQVADTVGCSLRTAKYRMKAAVQTLETELRAQGVDGGSL